MKPHETKKNQNDDFRKILEAIAQKHSSIVEIFTDFACMSACALAMQSREDEYMSVAKRYQQEELKQFAIAYACLVEEMNAHEFTDILGPYYSEIGSNFTRQNRGEFYTPQPVCEMMARMIVDVDKVVEEGKPLSVNEPAGGSGGAILALAKLFAPSKTVDLLRVTCQDISKLACDMAYINLTLWGVPARIIHGDTLRMTIEHDWRNIHWFRVGEHDREQVRSFTSAIKRLFKDEEPQEGVSADAPTNMQAEFDF